MTAVPMPRVAAPADAPTAAVPLGGLRADLLAAAGLSGLANLLLLTPTLYMLQVYDRVLVSRSELTLLAVSLLALLLLATVGFSEVLRSRVLVRIGVALDRDLGGRVFQASFGAAAAGQAQRGERALADLLQLRQFATGPGMFAMLDAPWLPVYLAATFFLHPLLGWLAVACAGLQLLVAWRGHHRSARLAVRAADTARDARIALKRQLHAADAVHAMGMLPGLRARWQAAQDEAAAAGMHAHASAQAAMAASKLLRYGQQSLALGAGALLVLHGELTPGAMIAANLLVARALAPLDLVVSQWRGFVESLSAWGRVRELLRRHAPRLAGVVPPLRGSVRLQQLVATAPTREAPILKGLDLDIAAGQCVVVLGPSGSGKSTLARCIVGAWPHTSGAVLLDEVRVQEGADDSLGAQVGYVPQVLQLFDGTVAENIARMGRPDPAQVVAAARAVGLHEAILRLPAGYDTPLGSGAYVLSGGMRQRVALARALYGDPPLLVLDEPNASLDKAGEVALARTLADLRRRGRTVLLIAQRLSTLQFADRVLLLRDGAVAAWGPPARANTAAS